MDARLAVKSEQISKIFHTMEYGNPKKSTDLAKAWLQKRKLLGASSETVCSMLSDKYELPVLPDVIFPCTEFKPKLNSNQIAFTILKLADALDNQTELLCELEILARGILPKDTKKAVSLMTDYLRFYSSNVAASLVEKSNCYKQSFSDDSHLALVGYHLAVALSLNRHVHFNLQGRLFYLVQLLVETAISVGFLKEQFTFTIVETIKASASPKGKIPMIVFNNADLDSACESTIGAVWDHQGILPWSVDKIIVQEDVFEQFVGKLKKRLEKVRIGEADDKLADISFPCLIDDYGQKLDKVIQDAIMMGIEVFRCGAQEKFSPTLFIGGRVYGNSVIVEDKMTVPSVTLLPFRNTTEAINLANNNRFNLAASVWSENVGLINEVTRKLKAQTVWVNSHGLFRADISYSGYPNQSYIGGLEGAFTTCARTDIQKVTFDESISGQNEHTLISTIKKHQVNWENLTISARANVLKRAAVNMDKDLDTLKKSSNYNDIDKWIAKFLSSSKISARNNSSIVDYDIKSYTEPVGVIGLICESVNYISCITEMIVLGNAVVVLYKEEEPTVKFLKGVAKYLPGVLLVLQCNYNTIENIAKENNIRLITTLNIANAKALYIEEQILSNSTFAFTKVKNVWLNRGDSN